MKWLHLSDVHFDFINDGTSTRLLRDDFQKFVKDNNITVDEIFFTGDFRNAKTQNDKDLELVAKEATDFIKYIASSVGVTDFSHIHIVPGNHDLITDDNSEKELKEICDKYNGNFFENDKLKLKNRFSFFEQCSKLLDNKIWDNFLEGCIHRFQLFSDFSVIYLNTAIACGKKCDRGNLKIGSSDLYDILKKVNSLNGNKPIFILAHHPMEFIDLKDLRIIKDMINQFDTSVLWLCGDYHLIFENKTYEIGELTTGCFKIDSGTQAGFFIGEYVPTKGVSIQAYVGTPRGKWDYSTSYSEFANNALPSNLRQYDKFPLKYNIAKHYASQGDYAGAIKYCTSALKEEILDNKIRLKMLLDLGFWYCWIDKNKEAEEILMPLIIEFASNNDKRSMALCYNYLGLVNDEMNKWASSEYNYIQAKKLYMELRAETSSIFQLKKELFQCYANMGLMYFRWGQSSSSSVYYGNAKKYYEIALSFFKDNEEVLQNDSAIFYNNYALFCDNQKKYLTAINFYDKALSIKSKTIGQWHISTARIYANKGLAYYNLGDYENAIKECEQAKRIYSEHNEMYCRDALRNLGTLAASKSMLKKYDDALDLLFMIREIRIKKYGENDTDVAQTDHNIGKIYLEKKDYSNADFYLCNAYRIRNLKMPTHRYTIETMQLLAKLNDLQTKNKNSLEWYIKIYDIQKEIFGVENEEVLNTKALIDNLKNKI